MAIGEEPVAFFVGGTRNQMSGVKKNLSSCARWTAEGGCPNMYQQVDRHIFSEEKVMSSSINPEAAEPSITQAFEQSDRNPAVTEFGEGDAGGGQLPAPASAESRVTQPGAAPSADAGLTNYEAGDGADSGENEAEHEG